MDRVYSMLGIAAKAGNVKSGAFLTEQEILAGRAKLVLLAKDAGSNTVKQIRDKCASRQIPLLVYGSAEGLGHALGKELRTCCALTDSGLSESIGKLIDQSEERGKNGENED
ncbi:MAG: ribosomal L7Ae/L30e/S12e/Gadd45 family protein [Firmicutes bacterium]|nr:ribosomal L7Ae/L30e/S12e/Gadd45 family protein [Bacillota bacterium]